MKKTIKVGSRNSALAVAQTKIVIETLKKHNPDLNIEMVTMGSHGDRNLKKSLDSYNMANLFSDDLEQALFDKIIDIAVHSYKDLPIDENPELPIVALGKRGNPLDSLALSDSDRENKVIGTSCRRRALQLKALYPNYTTKMIRGAVPLRLEQMDNGDFDGVVLASVGLERLGLDGRITREFTKEEMVPSACQGVKAIQGRKGEDYSYLKCFDCEESHIISEAELTFVRELRADGNNYNNGVMAEIQGDQIDIIGIYITPDNRIIKDSISGDVKDHKQLALQLAKRVYDGGQ